MTNLPDSVRGDSAPVKPQPKYLHGFSFDTEEERQSAAEDHHLWDAFETVFRRKWDDRKPVMSNDSDRMLFVWFIEGACQEWLAEQEREQDPTEEE